MKYIASCSFGKDSLCMLLIIIQKKLPIDEVIFFDLGKEFSSIYETRNKVLPLLITHGIKYTELYPETTFDYIMFSKPIRKKGTEIIHRFGASWCGKMCRWGTGLKIQAIKRHLQQSYNESYTQYVGIAFDEKKRLLKNRKGNYRFLLAELQMTERDCLTFCYQNGFFWEEHGFRLYDILDRVSCWCCRNKNIKELRNIYLYLPEYWQRLKLMQSRLKEPMKGVGHSIFDLEKRFFEENRQLKFNFFSSIPKT